MTDPVSQRGEAAEETPELQQGAAASVPDRHTEAVPAQPGLYTYAIVPSSLSAGAVGTGINAAPVELVAVAEGLAAVVHHHTGAPYDGADADVERWILEHGNVVERAWEAAGTVLPMSFNVIVAAGAGADAGERLKEWLAEAAPALTERLNALRNRVELRVEISLDQHKVAEESAEAAELREEMARRPPGVQRLLQKRLDTMERDIADQLADELYPQYRRRLAVLSEDLTENRRAHRPAGYVSVLTVALLVPREQIERVGMELTAITEEQPAADVRFLGPWPPYSFADVPELANS